MSVISTYETKDALQASKISTFLNFWNLEKGHDDLDEISKFLVDCTNFL